MYFISKIVFFCYYFFLMSYCFYFRVVNRLVVFAGLYMSPIYPSYIKYLRTSLSLF